ncbi:response regulator [Haloferula chungangensis]|uniref:Response regulator n=1 Tax=Haloferula chungangensis TaxID=1048331 RepID=A0ABW2LBG7_9BACT
MIQPIRVLLVEDSPDYRQVVELALERESDIDLVGVYGAAEVALRGLRDAKSRPEPDIVLLDLNLPGMSGLEAIPYLRKEAPEARILILSQSDREADVLRAISEGAAGYLLKSSTVKQIKNGIRTVMEGKSLLDQGVANFMVNAIRNKSSELILEKPLTEREMEILTLLGEGLVKKEIGNRLGIGFATVATHIRHIYDKLRVENAPAAISKAYRSGILPPKD